MSCVDGTDREELVGEGGEEAAGSDTAPALGAMLGAGLFLGIAPAAALAGTWAPVGIVLGAVAGLCAARVGAAHAATHPGPAAVHRGVRDRLGPSAYGAGVTTAVVAELAGTAAIAGTAAAYLAPSVAGGVAPALVLLIVLAATAGAPLRGSLSRAGVGVALLVLAVVVGVCFAVPPPAGVSGGAHPGGVLGASAVAFFAFRGIDHLAGARSGRSRMRAPVVLAIAVVLQVVVFLAAVYQLGPVRLSLSPAPLLDSLSAAGGPALRVACGIGTAAALLPVLLGALTSARSTGSVLLAGGRLSERLTESGRGGTPYRLDLLIGVSAAVLAALVDPETLLVVAACCGLVHYALAAVAAWPERTTHNPGLRTACLGGMAAVVLPAGAPVAGPAAAGGAVVVGLLAGRFTPRVRK